MKKKIHYPNLNSLRFIAAFVVIIHHTEQIKFAKGLPNIWNEKFIEIFGALGVDLFFVLSGFLITSLLFIEKETSGGISVKKFIIRRLLRIWPVYFLVMIVAFFILPHIPILQIGRPFVSVYDNYVGNIIMYVFFIPHVQLAVYGPILYCAQAWSIGIEEQFYLIWPFLIKYLNVKKTLVVIFAFITLYLVVCFCLFYISKRPSLSQYFNLNQINVLVTLFRSILKFDCLLIGGVFAIANRYVKPGSILINKYFQLIYYVLSISLTCLAWNLFGLFWEIHAVLYGFIIMNLVRSETSIINIDYPIFDFLGKISYGIYMYHILVINIVLTILYQFSSGLYVYPVIFSLVIALSYVSYRFIEGYFLKLKKSYSVIVTG